MLRLLHYGVIFWLGIMELWADWRGWKGLSWSGRTHIFWLIAAFVRTTRAKTRVRWYIYLAILCITFLPAVALQILLSSTRNLPLNPALQLRPGHYPNRTITRLNIPMSVGHLPALWVQPLGEVTTGLCVIHGSGCNKAFYAWRLVDELMHRKVGVLLIDLDGHGENPRPQHFPAITEDVAVAVAWLRERYQRVGVLGMSLGGCVAARALADGVHVDGLIILASPPVLHFKRSDVWREAFALVQPRLLELFRDSSVYHMIRAWDSPRIRAHIGTWDLIDQLDLGTSLGQITNPLLLLYGGRDSIVKPTQVEHIRQRMPPHATLHIIPGASHLTLMVMPVTLRTVGEWIDTHLVTGTDQPTTNYVS